MVQPPLLPTAGYYMGSSSLPCFSVLGIPVWGLDPAFPGGGGPTTTVSLWLPSCVPGFSAVHPGTWAHPLRISCLFSASLFTVFQISFALTGFPCQLPCSSAAKSSGVGSKQREVLFILPPRLYWNTGFTVVVWGGTCGVYQVCLEKLDFSGARGFPMLGTSPPGSQSSPCF